MLPPQKNATLNPFCGMSSVASTAFRKLSCIETE